MQSQAFRIVTEEKKGFNLGLDLSKRINYSVHVDLNARTVTVSHYGVSELYSCSGEKVVLRCDPNFPLESLIFPSINVFGGKTVEFYNFRSSLVPVPSVFNTPASTNQPVVQLAAPKQQAWNPPVCVENKDCHCYYKRLDDPERVLHMSQELHTCQWGNQCKFLQNPEHLKVTLHEDLPRCNSGGKCPRISDPLHRSQMSHVGFWDWMLVCHRPNCQGCDPTKYYHQ